MTSEELSQIVEQRMADPRVLGRLACNLRSEDEVRQRHHDGSRLKLTWNETGGAWRCHISIDSPEEARLAQVDVHENATVKVETYGPCRVTVSPEEGILCLTRYRPV